MKKSSSFYLEEDIFDEIERYQNDRKISSRNTALERIILEWKNLLEENKLLKQCLGNSTFKDNKEVSITEEKIIKKKIQLLKIYLIICQINDKYLLFNLRSRYLTRCLRTESLYVIMKIYYKQRYYYS